MTTVTSDRTTAIVAITMASTSLDRSSHCTPPPYRHRSAGDVGGSAPPMSGPRGHRSGWGMIVHMGFTVFAELDATIGPPESLRPGQVVVLNGTSSAGKSGIAAELQRAMEVPYFHLAIDRFHAMRARKDW